MPVSVIKKLSLSVDVTWLFAFGDEVFTMQATLMDATRAETYDSFF